MSHVHEGYFKPYFRYVFWWVFLSLLVLTVVSSAFGYYLQTKKALQNTRHDLMQIAQNVADNIPVSVHETLVNFDQQKSPEYKSIEAYFKNVIAANPKIDDIYTLRRTETPHVLAFVVSGKDDIDSNGNNLLDDEELKAKLGEEYDTLDLPEMENGFFELTADKNVTYDKWGAWISGYAPLRDKNGKSVALVGVDFSYNYIEEQKNEILASVLEVNLFLLPFFAIISLWLAKKLSDMFKLLAQGLKRMSHGDLDYVMPKKGNKEEKIFAELFENIKQLIGGMKNKDKNDNDKI